MNARTPYIYDIIKHAPQGAGVMSGTIVYQNRQYGRTTLLVFLVTALFLIVVFGLVTEWHLALLIPFAILAGAAVIFGSLTVVVDQDNLKWYFGPGLWKYRLPLKEIVDAKPVTNKWWYGWGVRVTPHGWLFNVDGLDAVEITTDDGVKRRLGTNQAEALSQILANK